MTHFQESIIRVVKKIRMIRLINIINAYKKQANPSDKNNNWNRCRYDDWFYNVHYLISFVFVIEPKGLDGFFLLGMKYRPP